MIDVRHLGPADYDMLMAVPPGLFDYPMDPAQAQAFLDDPLHMIVLAYDGDLAVSMATGTVVLHPDKPPSLFINEVGTRDSHLRQGIATQLVTALIDAGRARGCKGAWLGTEPDNGPALGLYRKMGATEQVFVGFAWDGAFDDDTPN